MKNRLLTLDFAPFPSSYQDVKVQLIQDGFIEEFMASEEAKKYDYRLFLLEQLIDAGYELRPLTLNYNIPIDTVGMIEQPLSMLTFEKVFASDHKSNPNEKIVESSKSE